MNCKSCGAEVERAGLASPKLTERDENIICGVIVSSCLDNRDKTRLCDLVRSLSAPPVAGVSASSRPQEGWQPMETAPRPERGRRKVIDVWCVTDDHESAKFYFGNTMCGVKDQMMWQGRVSEVYWLDGAWRPATGLRMHGLTVTPIAWRKLPDPPAARADVRDRPEAE